MRTGMAGLALWSFLMASAHGAGLMLVPILLPLGHGGSHASHLPASESLTLALAAVGVHTLAMLAVTGAIAVAVYDWLGLAFLRRGWINLDLLWTAALAATGLLLLISAAALVRWQHGGPRTAPIPRHRAPGTRGASYTPTVPWVERDRRRRV